MQRRDHRERPVGAGINAGPCNDEPLIGFIDVASQECDLGGANHHDPVAAAVSRRCRIGPEQRHQRPSVGVTVVATDYGSGALAISCKIEQEIMAMEPDDRSEFLDALGLSATGMDKGALITVTCLVAGLSSILMGLMANAPFMMAPGMGVNAFFAFSLCLGQGIAWQTALGVVFISGMLFVLLTAVGVREKIINSIPANLRLAASVGIGLFITFIGFQNMGLIVKSDG